MYTLVGGSCEKKYARYNHSLCGIIRRTVHMFLWYKSTVIEVLCVALAKKILGQSLDITFFLIEIGSFAGLVRF